MGNVCVLVLPHFVEELYERIVDHKRDRHVQTHATQTRYSAFVEAVKRSALKMFTKQKHLRHWAFVACDLHEAIERVPVLLGLKTLHARLDNVDGCVAENGCGTCEATHTANNELVDLRTKMLSDIDKYTLYLNVRVATTIPVLERLHDIESNRLIATLLHNCRRQTLVAAAQA